MRTRTRPLLVAAVPAAALLLAACGTPAASGGSTASGSMSMTIGYTAIGAAYDDLYVCQDQGVFAKNGLTVKLTLLNSSSQLFAALASNSVQIGVGVAQSTAAGALNGVPLKYVALPIPHYYLEMWGKSSLSADAPSLKGKKIGLSSPGSLGDASVNAWLAEQGLTDKDIQKTFLKSTPAEVTALEKGAVDAIVTQPPTGTQTRAKGFTKIMDFTRFKAAANAYTVKADYDKNNSTAVAAFVKSEVECLSILHNDEKTAIASIIKHSGNDDPALAKYSYDFFNPLWAKAPTVDPGLLTAAFKAAAQDKGIDPPANADQYVDNSYVDALQKQGYINSLYKD